MFRFFYKRPKARVLSVTSTALFEALIGLFLWSGYLKKTKTLALWAFASTLGFISENFFRSDRYRFYRKSRVRKRMLKITTYTKKQLLEQRETTAGLCDECTG